MSGKVVIYNGGRSEVKEGAYPLAVFVSNIWDLHRLEQKTPVKAIVVLDVRSVISVNTLLSLMQYAYERNIPLRFPELKVSFTGEDRPLDVVVKLRRVFYMTISRWRRRLYGEGLLSKEEYEASRSKQRKGKKHSGADTEQGGEGPAV